MTTSVDQADRKRLSDELDTTFFVEAGAGTGKTRELVERVVVLVANGRLRMPELAAITFTLAAAAELRDRIRRELAHGANDHLRWTPEQRRLCLDASRSVDQAHIQTIHAFAGDLLRTFPLEAQLPPGFEIWDEMQRDRDFDERFRAWLYDEVPSSDRADRREAVARALLLGLQPERLKLLTQRLQEHYDLLATDSAWERGSPMDPIRVANESGAALEELNAVLYCARLGDTKDLCRTVRSLAFTVQQLVAATSEPAAFEAMVRYLLKRPNPMQGRGPDWEVHPVHGNPLPFIRDTLRSTTVRITTTLEAHRAAALADLLGYLAEFTLAYARDRKSRGVATFHDLLVWSRDLLRDYPDVRLAAHKRMQRLFVDEFQDTDPLQAELVAYLAADAVLVAERDWHVLLNHLVPGKLFVVGDPKQSIYRFRRAEVAVYQKVYSAAAQPGASTASLVQTFRSVAPVVDWVNNYFSVEMQPDAGVQATYSRLEPRPALDGLTVDDTATGVRTVGGPDDNKAGDRWTVEARAIARIARKAVIDEWPITEQIDGSWRVRPAEFRDICVLLPTRTNLRRLERAFEDNSVPYRMESGSLVVFTQEVRDLVACLRAIEDPSDQVALVGALRSPAYACSDVDLLRWVEEGGQLSYLWPRRPLEGPVGQAFISLAEFHARRQERSAAATIEALLDDRALSLFAMDHPRPREALRRQRYVVAQARKLASAGDSTLRGFVHWIETLRKNELYDAESAVPDSDENAVRMMTIHGSKGLEFPIVILSGLGGGVRANDGVQLLANHAEGHLEARCTARIGPAFATLGFDGDREKRLEQAQQLRLLYVASTRAREHLVLSLFHSQRYGKSSNAASIWNRLATLERDGTRPTEILQAELESLPPVLLDTLDGLSAPTSEDLEPEAHAAAESAWLSARHTLLATLGQEQLATPSALAHEPEPPDDFVTTVDDNLLRSPRRPRGSTNLGIAVHTVLQWLDLHSLSNLDVLSEQAAAEHGVAANEVAGLAEAAALSAPVRRAVASGQYWREVPVNVEIIGVSLEGSIDLLYQESDGSMIVVDYKTDQVSGRALDLRAGGYAVQGAAYALAIQRATGTTVARVEFVFAAGGDDRAEVFTVREPDIAAVERLIVQRSTGR